LDLKTILSDFCGQSLICELILALVSLWLLVNSFKESFKEKRPIDFFIIFLFFFLDILIILLFFKDILVILLLFFPFFDLTEVTA